ncbi:M16 family metallopeptidase [Hymenobacter jeollabukensis]|uniref:Insulinase family protein n=1 Tax=Hymenobacter jeollabukensis TaxID=2025313 RepID=A0A5R8WJX6_9BACT|nr:pitrilysin family protein [Hymenobacter jeollabukensis]TLM88932.1 insulinase family protein [Hymenobacter jeollabukensis]
MKSSLLLLLSGLLLGPLTALAQHIPAGAPPRPFRLPARTTFTLPNGLKAQLVPYGNLPKVTVSLVLQTGNVHEQATEAGLADIVGGLLSEGSHEVPAAALATQVAHMGGTLNVAVGETETALSATVLAEHSPAFVALLGQLMQQPALPAAALPRVTADLKRRLAQYGAQPGTQARLAYAGALFGSHPYGRGLPAEEQLDAHTIEQVRAFYAREYGAQRASLYIVGRFDTAAVRPAVGAALGGWARGPARHVEVPQPQARGQLLVLDRPGAQQTSVVMGLPVVPPSHPDYNGLRLMNTLLGGGLTSRITRNIRGDKGYTYGSTSSIYPRYGCADWGEGSDVATAHSADALREIFKEIIRLGQEAPPAQELREVQEQEAGQFVLRNSSPAGIITQLRFLDLHGLPDSYLTEQVPALYAITPAQVQELARQYLRPEAMTVVLVGDRATLTRQLQGFEVQGRRLW